MRSTAAIRAAPHTPVALLEAALAARLCRDSVVSSYSGIRPTALPSASDKRKIAHFASVSTRGLRSAKLCAYR